MSNANALELGMLALINGERAAAGLDPLRLITLLNDAAEDHSAWMLEANEFSHTGEDGSTPTERMEEALYPFEGNSMSAENIGWQSARGAEGFEDDVAQVHQGLMNSPGHRANILNPDAEDIGIGIEIGTFSGSGGDFEAVMVTQVFASTDADLSAWVDPQNGEETEVDPPVTPEDPAEEETPDVEEPIAENDEPTDEDPLVCEVPGDDVAMTDQPVEEEPDEEIVVAMDDDASGEDVADEDTDGEDEDIAIDDVPPEFAFPCDLTQFTVDLSDAFEFRQEGDQLIWETSEEKVMAAFQTAFDEWTALLEEPQVDDLAALMLDDTADVSAAMMASESDASDEWMMDCGV